MVDDNQETILENVNVNEEDSPTSVFVGKISEVLDTVVEKAV